MPEFPDLILKCAICSDVEAPENSEQIAELEKRWFAHLYLELCEKCKKTPIGKAKIELAENGAERAITKFTTKG